MPQKGIFFFLSTALRIIILFLKKNTFNEIFQTIKYRTASKQHD
jgi:hypothetical protein